MKFFKKPEDVEFDNLVNLILETTELNNTFDDTDYDEVLGMIWKVKEMKNIAWRVDTMYHILLNKVNRE